MKRTPFYNAHVKSGGRLINFGGFVLPVNYGSQIKEHETVRVSCGMFDVSHMCITDIKGTEANAFLRFLLANDINKLHRHRVGKALYSVMLNHKAGIIDDLIVYYLADDHYRLVTNAATREKDFHWITKSATKYSQVEIKPVHNMAMLAVQGPTSRFMVGKIFPEIATQLEHLKPFSSISSAKYFFARTGYTGEDGLEIILPESDAESFWDKLILNGVIPCGLGARDTLRLEAGMNLYGHDMDESITPSECGVDWVVDLSDSSRDFAGKSQYIALKDRIATQVQVGLILQDKGVFREGQHLFDESGIKIGVVTSGTFSPSLKASIAIARVGSSMLDQEALKVDIRGNLLLAKIVNLPFVRNGKILVDLA